MKIVAIFCEKAESINYKGYRRFFSQHVADVANEGIDRAKSYVYDFLTYNGAGHRVMKTGQAASKEATPEAVADWLVSLAGNIHPGMRILEPSAGRGAIIKAILKVCPEAIVDYLELMPENRSVLAKSGLSLHARCVGEDFLQYDPTYLYDLIIANPPFSKNQDILHARKMYDLLASGGTMAVITSRHWLTGSENQCFLFRQWIEDKKGQISKSRKAPSSHQEP